MLNSHKGGSKKCHDSRRNLQFLQSDSRVLANFVGRCPWLSGLNKGLWKGCQGLGNVANVQARVVLCGYMEREKEREREKEIDR